MERFYPLFYPSHHRWHPPSHPGQHQLLAARLARPSRLGDSGFLLRWHVLSGDLGFGGAVAASGHVAGWHRDLEMDGWGVGCGVSGFGGFSGAETRGGDDVWAGYLRAVGGFGGARPLWGARGAAAFAESAASRGRAFDDRGRLAHPEILKGANRLARRCVLKSEQNETSRVLFVTSSSFS